ncbi:DUF3995 domain-containing protein [Roseiterribacter gracilis]|uniref:Membrane protein n=1 Tax=Roseiterribacter gracilis TaxID=2812848 RepID=A0A8S8X8K4_9PROT|nr:membrane protein [Rhodospirillales bacterium TMPK1]
MLVALAFTVAAVLNTLAVLHVYWALGGRWGKDAAVPRRATGERLFEPSSRSTWLVALALAIAAYSVRLAVRAGPLHTIAAIAVALLALAFLARAIGDFRWVGAFKRERESKFAQLDTRYFVPLCLLLAVACACISLDALV